MPYVLEYYATRRTARPLGAGAGRHSMRKRLEYDSSHHSRCCSPSEEQRGFTSSLSSAASSAVHQWPSSSMRVRRTTAGCGQASPHRALRAMR